MVRVCANDITHHRPVDDCNFFYVNNEEFDDDWWQRGPGWESPPNGIRWDSFVDLHTVNLFARGDCVLIKKSHITSKFHLYMVDVTVGDKCVLIYYKYEPHKCYGNIQKHYFLMFSYRKKEIIRVLEGSFCHEKDDFRNKLSDVPKNLL